MYSLAKLLALLAVAAIDVTFTHWIYSIMHVVSIMTSRSALRLLARVIIDPLYNSSPAITALEIFLLFQIPDNLFRKRIRDHL
jgi:hypothetical protein